MFVRSLITFAALLPLAIADCTQQYIKLDNFVEPNACVPDGYFQAQDLGNTNPTELVARCESQCTAYNNCEAFVGQLWKAADSGLYSGQCFYYSSPPSGPRQCVDHPTILLAEKKDHSPLCLTSSLSVATVFCSSYLSIGTVTVYTSTSTPVSIVSSTTTSVKTIVSKSVTTAISTSTRTRSVVTVSTVPTTISSTKTVTTRTTSFSTTYTQVHKRDVAPTPACLSTAPASMISAACSCLSLTSTTVSLVSTAPTSTSTQVATRNSRSTTSTTSTKTQLTIETTTALSTSTKSVTTRTVSTSTSTIVVVKPTELSIRQCPNPADACQSQPNPCLSGNANCGCFLTTSGLGVCGDPSAPCGPTCESDADCGPGSVCYVASCCGGNACSNPGELVGCANPATPTRLFRRAPSRREMGRAMGLSK